MAELIILTILITNKSYKNIKLNLYICLQIQLFFFCFPQVFKIFGHLPFLTNTNLRLLISSILHAVLRYLFCSFSILKIIEAFIVVRFPDGLL